MLPSAWHSTVLLPTFWAEVIPGCVTLCWWMLLSNMPAMLRLWSESLWAWCAFKRLHWFIDLTNFQMFTQGSFFAEVLPTFMATMQFRGVVNVAPMLVHYPLFIWANSATWLWANVFVFLFVTFSEMSPQLESIFCHVCTKNFNTDIVHLPPQAQVLPACIIAKWSFLASSDSKNCPQ